MQKLASGVVWVSMVRGPVLCEMAFNLRGVRYCQWSITNDFAADYYEGCSEMIWTGTAVLANNKV